MGILVFHIEIKFFQDKDFQSITISDSSGKVTLFQEDWKANHLVVFEEALGAIEEKGVTIVAFQKTEETGSPFFTTCYLVLARKV